MDRLMVHMVKCPNQPMLRIQHHTLVVMLMMIVDDYNYMRHPPGHRLSESA
jgi:hypothetical protein